jgi:hypothetical protein
MNADYKQLLKRKIQMIVNYRTWTTFRVLAGLAFLALEVPKGSGEFELAYDVKRVGVLHVTFYGVLDGKPFGGEYFGTKPQMAEIQGWTLSDYEK